MTDFDRRLIQALSGRLGRGFFRTEVNNHVASALDHATDAQIYTSLNMWAPLQGLCLDIEERNRDGGLPHG